MPRKQVSTSQAVCLPAERIERSILMIRGERVMLDADLAELYGVETRVLVQAVKRNAERFPPDFAFELTAEEFNILRSQIVISRWGGRRYLPYAFTEHGIAMLSSVLHSPRAVRANIEIMRAFIRLRRMLASHQDLAKRLDELEQRYDAQFKTVFDAIRALMTNSDKPRRSIGFRVEEMAAMYGRRRRRASSR
ncbi:MAG: DNA-binding protein [Candidatus Methylomirabilota bacterium]|nr:ORF6N domain-containing protein [Candidatus Methylomirabilis sp.]PWB42829.1 MAG: DNA-binding protein [candidate division NC10 bacterium]